MPTNTPNHPQLRVGLLLCADMGDYGGYAQMFQEGMAAVDAGLELRALHCDQGEMPEGVDAFDAFLISGSQQSVYEEVPWIGQLQEFVRCCRGAGKKTVGICFGHQLIAQALGGEVRRADVGWGLGIRSTQITEPQAWMAGGELCAPGRLNLVAMHRDQVLSPPPGARVIAGDAFCRVGMFVDGEVMLGMQGHPEFDKAFCRVRIEARKADLPPTVYKSALASLQEMELDSDTALRWVAQFIRG